MYTIRICDHCTNPVTEIFPLICTTQYLFSNLVTYSSIDEEFTCILLVCAKLKTICVEYLRRIFASNIWLQSGAAWTRLSIRLIRLPPTLTCREFFPFPRKHFFQIILFHFRKMETLSNYVLQIC